MQELTNPCHECDHHLAGGNKNFEKCRDCDKRIAYVNAIDKSPSSSVNENVDLVGHGGSDVQKSKQDLTDYETAEEISSSMTIDPIQEHIKEICKSAGITLGQIRKGIKGQGDKNKIQAFHKIRDRIIKSLASGDFGCLNQTQIGDYLGVSNHVISTRMGKIGIPPMHPSGAQRHRKKSVKKKAPKVKAPATPPEVEETSKQMIIDFTDHPEIYQGVMEAAADQLRTPEMQALYILKKFHYWGQIPPDTNNTAAGKTEIWPQ